MKLLMHPSPLRYAGQASLSQQGIMAIYRGIFYELLLIGDW